MSVFVCYCCFIRSYYVVQDDLKLSIFLHQTPSADIAGMCHHTQKDNAYYYVEHADV